MKASTLLSPRQVEVLELIRHGRGNRQIARGLGISELTVKNHVSAILEKLGVDCRAAAVGRGFDLGILAVASGPPSAPAGLPPRAGRRGLTLIELLVVIAIVALLVALLVPAVQSARESARRVACGNKLRQLSLALEQFNAANGHYPAGAINLKLNSPRVNVWIQTLPYVEQGSLFGQLDLAFFGQAGDGINNGVIWVKGPYVALLAEGQPLLLCPSDGYGGTHSPPQAADHVRGQPRNNYYGFFNGLDRRDLSYDYSQVVPNNPPPARTRLGMFDINRVTRAALVRDGLSNTMAITEGLTGGPLEVRGFAWSDQPCGAFVHAEHPPNSLLPDRCYAQGTSIHPGWCVNDPARNLPAAAAVGGNDSCVARSRHPGGVLVAFADGSVRFVADSIETAVWRAGGTIAGGEMAGPFE